MGASNIKDAWKRKMRSSEKKTPKTLEGTKENKRKQNKNKNYFFVSDKRIELDYI